MKRSTLAVFLSLAVFGVAWAQEQETRFELHRVHFDESVVRNKPVPQIPKGWRLVTAEHVPGANETHLWFQDQAGSVFMVQGFMSAYDGHEFVLTERGSEIEVSR